MKRIHNTSSPFIKFNNIPINDQQLGYKPEGLWYGINGEWIEWCKSEMKDWIMQFDYELNLNLSKIKIISNLQELELFDKKYSIYKCEYIKVINWQKVAEKFYGIEINPYVFEARFNIKWYYGWDVASGCIWNKKAIINIKRHKNYERTTKQI